MVNFKYGNINTFDVKTVNEQTQRGFGDQNPRNRFARNLVNAMAARNQQRWSSQLGDANKFEALSLALAPNAVVTVARYQDLRRAVPQYFLTALNPKTGKQLAQIELPSEPLPGGLLIDREGRIVVALLNGNLACFGR